MSDIAMLVAEEYERRVKNSRKRGNGEMEEVELFTGVSVLLAKKFEGWSNENYNLKEEMIKWVPNPKSQIGVAAINGLFSA